MKKSIPRLPDENPPPYTCAECWFYEPSEQLHHGACFAVPPAVLVDADGDLMCPRSIVMADDRGCIHWKPRQRPN